MVLSWKPWKNVTSIILSLLHDPSLGFSTSQSPAVSNTHYKNRQNTQFFSPFNISPFISHKNLKSFLLLGINVIISLTR